MEFDLKTAIPGWSDGICHMRVGDRARFCVSEDLTNQSGRGSPQGMLVFDIELVAIRGESSRGKLPLS